MIDKYWIDLKFEVRNFADAFVQLLCSIIGIIFLVIIKPFVRIYHKLFHFYWAHIASNRQVIRKVRRAIKRSKARSVAVIERIVNAFKKYNKLTDAQGNDLINYAISTFGDDRV